MSMNKAELKKMVLERGGIGAAFGIMVFLLINVAAGRAIIPGERRPHEAIAIPVVEMDPARLYATTCNQCHQAGGTGIPGQYPPLAGSSWVARDAETPIRVLLAGLQGPIEVSGNTFNNVMPAQSHLTDEQIAVLLTYVRSNFGNQASPVEPATVTAVRQSLSGRTTAWTAEELRDHAPGS